MISALGTAISILVGWLNHLKITDLIEVMFVTLGVLFIVPIGTVWVFDTIGIRGKKMIAAGIGFLCAGILSLCVGILLCYVGKKSNLEPSSPRIAESTIIAPGEMKGTKIPSLQPPGIPGPEDDVYLAPIPPDDTWEKPRHKPKIKTDFRIELGTSLLRQKQGLLIGPYASGVMGCPETLLIAIDYMPHIRITNTSSKAATVTSYSLQVRTENNAWETLRNIPLVPSSKLYFVHKIGPQVTEMLDLVPLDNVLREHLIHPGESLSGFALFGFPKTHAKLAQSKFTADSGDISVGYFPRPDIRIDLKDSLGRKIVDAPIELQYEPNSIKASTVHFRFGPVLSDAFQLSTISKCNP